jgi:hypothetical protein
MARVLTKLMQRANPVSAALQTDEAALSEPGTPARMTHIDADQRRTMIAEAAYFRSLSHAGSEVEDWLAAEQEVDAKVMAPSSQ